MTRAVRTYRLHGLTVRSDVALDETALVEAVPEPDVDIALGRPRRVPDEPGPGRLLLRLELGGHVSTLARDRDTTVLRLHGLCECEIAAGGRSVKVHLDADRDPAIAPIVVAGNLLSVLLALRGDAVLHASSVELGGQALAFLGASGVGKSTLAALFCALGAPLVSDDVLRVVAEDGRAWCFPGTTGVRLRSGAAELARPFASTSVSETADGRVAVAAPRTQRERLALAAVVVPEPTRGSDALRVDRLSGVDRMLDLLRHPRVLGWVDEEPLRAQFARLTDIAGVVPVYRAQLPWGPPFDPELAPRLARELGLEPPAG